MQAEPPTCWGDYVLFTDAAPVGPDAFSVGLCLPLRGVRMFQCPRWVRAYLASGGFMGLGARGLPSDLYEVAPGMCGQ